jgi:esterase
MAVSLCYRESGLDQTGRLPVVLLHGLFGAGDNLGSLARQLATTRRVVQVDLRNHGQSPHDDYMDLATMAADVLVLLQQLDIERCDIVGHSLGGKVAMEIALNHADRVRKLVIADIAPVSYGRGHDQVFAALAAVDLHAVHSRRDAEAMLTPHLAEPALRQFLLKSLYREENGGSENGDAYRWRFHLPALLANYDALRAAPNGDPFAGPTLFIRGELSDYVRRDDEPVMRRYFPDYTLETIPGAGHWVHGEKPLLFNKLVEDFLD